jgi:hypothetical protein
MECALIDSVIYVYSPGFNDDVLAASSAINVRDTLVHLAHRH